jgi:hypothetical protein
LLPGDDHISTAATDPTPLTLPPTRETQSQAANRWRREGIDATVAAARDRWRADYLADHPDCRRRDAHEHAWARALAEFPPSGVPEPPPEPSAEPERDPASEPPPLDPPAVASGGGVQGLGDLPADWPPLPANAALPIEVAWVQANRLRVVQCGQVDLSRALSPAPSYAALAWLETSVLFPAKWADVTVKASQDQQDDQQDVRREKVALSEVRTLLAEASSIPELATA